MKNYGITTLSEFLGERVVYRNLQPCDTTLPPFEKVRHQLGLPGVHPPRKSETAYAQVIVQLLHEIAAQEGKEGTLRHLFFVGDTHLLDATAFTNLCAIGGWSGSAFIGAENERPLQTEVRLIGEAQSLFLANRWAAIKEFDDYCRIKGTPIESGSVVVIDLDKTAIGARGRNDRAIDQARLQAVQETVAAAIGEQFDPIAFLEVYTPLNQPQYHPFTADNQDYLAYICLIISSGFDTLEEVTRRVQAGELLTFHQFIHEVEQRSNELPNGLRSLHKDIFNRVKAGDPTPFKAFRQREYLTTIGRFGALPEDASPERCLAEEIVITQEVRQMALEWLKRGVLLFGLSDKPDEAALPPPDLAAQGYPPLHRARTHAIGLA